MASSVGMKVTENSVVSLSVTAGTAAPFVQAKLPGTLPVPFVSAESERLSP